jgi:hypothetical protein
MDVHGCPRGAARSHDPDQVDDAEYGGTGEKNDTDDDHRHSALQPPDHSTTPAEKGYT